MASLLLLELHGRLFRELASWNSFPGTTASRTMATKGWQEYNDYQPATAKHYCRREHLSDTLPR